MRTFFILLSASVLLVAATAFISTSTDGYQVGDYAQDFSLMGVDGKKVSLSDYNNAEGFIVIFTCNTCPYAKMYEQRIKALHNSYAEKGYPVIAINPNCPERSPGDSMDKMKERAQEKEFGFAYLQDETQNVTKAYGATNTPHTYVLKKESPSKYKVIYIGAIDNNYRDASKANKHYVRNAVESLLQGKTPKEKSTKAIGCSIKWKMS